MTEDSNSNSNSNLNCGICKDEDDKTLQSDTECNLDKNDKNSLQNLNSRNGALAKESGDNQTENETRPENETQNIWLKKD